MTKGAFGKSKFLKKKCIRTRKVKNKETGEFIERIYYRHKYTFDGVCRVCGARKP
jgi:hypothetical protein